MKIQIEVISTQVVTPSSPTPHHLKNYKLSFIDQAMPSFLTNAYFFYPANNENLITNAQRSNLLKKSLSKALTLFYPLAGRLVGNNDYVNCNDKGVTYVEAQAKCALSDVINDPIPDEFRKLFPCDPDDAKDLCMVVQATFFCCGGLALGLGICHKIVDGFSYVMFLNSWASFSRGDRPVKSPKFESAILFPAKDLVNEIRLEKKENFVTKRFKFGSQKIPNLMALIGNRIAVATGKVFALQIYVDIRTRVVPPLSEYHFGNFVLPAIIVPSLEKDEVGTYGTVKKLIEAIRDIDGDFVEKLRQKNDPLFAISESKVDMLSFSNACTFPVHEANFGWGIPMLIGGPNMPVNNIVFFSPSLSGGGIDAWINLKEDDMVKFEADKELLKYVSRADGVEFISRM